MNIPYYRPVSCRCREARKELGLKQKEVAFRADVSKNWLCEIEKGANVSMENALRIASVLGKSVEELWELKQEQTQHS